VSALRDLVDVELGPTAWREVTQERIDAFAAATDDPQWIHTDPRRAAEGPFGTTIAHGFLTLSLVVHLGKTIPPIDAAAYQGVVMGVNYGLDKVRFPAPVPVGSRVRARRRLVAAEQKAPNTIQLKQEVSVEIDGGAKPACVAETLTRLVFA